MGCCGNKTSFKVTPAQIRNLAKTAKDVVMEVLKSGEIKVTKDISQRRMQICKQCPKLQGVRCEACGCFIEAKVILKVSHCPLNKW